MSFPVDRLAKLQLIGLRKYAKQYAVAEKDPQGLKVISILQTLQNCSDSENYVADRIQQIFASCNHSQFLQLVSLISAKACFYDNHFIANYAKVLSRINEMPSDNKNISLRKALKKTLCDFPVTIAKPLAFVSKKLSFINELVCLRLLGSSIYRHLWAHVQQHDPAAKGLSVFSLCSCEILKNIDEMCENKKMAMQLEDATFWEFETENLRKHPEKYNIYLSDEQKAFLLSLRKKGDWRKRATSSLDVEDVVAVCSETANTKERVQQTLEVLVDDPNKLSEMADSIPKMLMAAKDVADFNNATDFLFKEIYRADANSLFLYCQMMQLMKKGKLPISAGNGSFCEALINYQLGMNKNVKNFRRVLRVTAALFQADLVGHEMLRKLLTWWVEDDVLRLFELLQLVGKLTADSQLPTTEMAFWAEQCQYLAAACKNGAIDNRELKTAIKAFLKTVDDWRHNETTGKLQAAFGNDSSKDEDLLEKDLEYYMPDFMKYPGLHSDVIIQFFSKITSRSCFCKSFAAFLRHALRVRNVDEQSVVLEILRKLTKMSEGSGFEDPFRAALTKGLCAHVSWSLIDDLDDSTVEQFCSSFSLINEIYKYLGSFTNGLYMAYAHYVELIMLKPMTLNRMIVVYRIIRNVKELVESGAYLPNKNYAALWVEWSKRTMTFFKTGKGQSSNEATSIVQFLCDLEETVGLGRSLVVQSEDSEGKSQTVSTERIESIIADVSLSSLSKDTIITLRIGHGNMPSNLLHSSAKTLIEHILPQIVDHSSLLAAVKLCRKLRKVKSSCGKNMINALQLVFMEFLDPKYLETTESELLRLEQEAAETSLPQEQIILTDIHQSTSDLLVKTAIEVPRIVGHLYLRELITFEFVTSFIDLLLQSKNGHVFEGLMYFLGIAGAALLTEVVSEGKNEWWSSFFQKVESFSRSSDSSVALRFACREILIAKMNGFPFVSYEEQTTLKLKLMVSELTPELATTPARYHAQIESIRQHVTACPSEDYPKIFDFLLDKMKLPTAAAEINRQNSVAAVLPISQVAQIGSFSDSANETQQLLSVDAVRQSSIVPNEHISSETEGCELCNCKCEPVVVCSDKGTENTTAISPENRSSGKRKCDSAACSGSASKQMTMSTS